MCRNLLVKSATQSSSHIFPMESSDELLISGYTNDDVASEDRWGIGKLPVLLGTILSLFGSKAGGPLMIGFLLVRICSSSTFKKLPEAPESAVKIVLWLLFEERATDRVFNCE